MHSPIRALLWERWRRTWWAVLLAMACFVLAGLDTIALDAGDGDEIMLFLSPPIFLLFGVLILGHCERERLDGTFPGRLLRLPLPTVTLAAAHLGYGAAVVGLGCTLMIGTAHLRGAATPDLMRFAALVLVAYFVFQTLAWIWGPHALWACVLGLATPLAIGLGMFILRHTALMSPSGLCLFCLAVIGLCCVVSVWVISRDRCGKKDVILEGPWLRQVGFGGRTQPFASARAAQVWYEWRLMGRRLPLYAVVFVVLLLAFSLALRWIGFFDSPHQHPPVPAMQAWVIPLMLPALVLGAWFASLGRFAMDHNERISGRWNFVIARPMSTSVLASCRLRTGLRSILAAFVVVGLACAALVVWAWAEGRLDDFGVLADSFGAWTSASAVALACVSILAAAAVAVWAFFWMGPEIFGLCVAGGVVIFISELARGPEEILIASGWLLGAAIATVALRAYRAAGSRELLSERTVRVAAAALLLVAAGAISLSIWFTVFDSMVGDDSQYFWFAAVTVALAFLPPAYVPLRMARHRHR